MTPPLNEVENWILSTKINSQWNCWMWLWLLRCYWVLMFPVVHGITISKLHMS